MQPQCPAGTVSESHCPEGASAAARDRLPLPSYFPEKFKRIHVELTNRCNFSCVFCPDCRMTRPRGFMDEDLALSAVDQIADLGIAEKITFHVMGEPLLHPGLFRILERARQRNLPVGLTTNGALLVPSMIQRIAEQDLHQIDISLQTPDEESFHRTRGTRMAFDKYREGLLGLLDACSKRPAQPIFKVRIMTTRFAGKLRTKLAIPDFLGSTKALHDTVREWAQLVYERLGMPFNRPVFERNLSRIRIWGWNVIEIAPKVFIETYVLTDWGNAFSDGKIVEASRGYCFGMRDHFAILYTGDVVLCCVDYDGNTAVGNLQDNSLDAILRSAPLAAIMEGFEEGRLEHPYCRKCLGSSSKLGTVVKPFLATLGLKVLRPFFYRTYKLFE